MKTFGVAVLEDGEWCVTCEPHVAIRIKRVFESAVKADAGVLKISATPEHTRDLEWFCTRYPLDFEEPEELERLAREYDRTAQAVQEIMAGASQLPDAELAFPLRDYQKPPAEIALATGGLLVADQLGLGKTVEAIGLIARQLPALVVVQPHLQRQWKAELERFLPFAYVHIIKKGSIYPIDHQGRDPDVVICSYYKLWAWADHFAGKFPTVIFDEVQELRAGGIKSGPNRKYIAALQVAYAARYRMGLSGTPIYNYGEEFFSVMNVIRPDSLGTLNEFRREWCVSYGTHYKIKDPKAFGTFAREAGLMIRRTRSEVGRELPPVQTVLHYVDHDQKALVSDSSADELAKLLLSKSARSFDRMKAGGEFDMRMRQATGIAKAPYVAEFVRMLLEDGSPVVMFGWHRAVYGIWLERLEEHKPALYTGTESPAKKAAEVERFKSGDTPLLIMSLRSGLGVDGLQYVCDRAVMGELDWSPGVMEQCIGRVFRDGQPNPVMAYHLVADDGSDPVMVDILGLKKSQLSGVNDPKGDLVIPKETDPNHVKRLAEDYLRRRRKA